MALKYTKETVSAGFVRVHPLGQLSGVVTLPLGRVSFHTENLVPTRGSQRVCGEQTPALG